MLLAPGEDVPSHHTHYIIESIVGTGAYGAVYAARDVNTPGRQIALKEFFPARHPRDQAPLQALFDRERMVGMQASSHPLMPTFYEAFQNDGNFYLAQEFIVGTTLDTIIVRRHPLPREWILKWSVSLCDALAFLHSRQIVHHDLKPANIRITPQGHLVLLDFGAAQYFGAGHEHDKPVELYGTEGYLPPELEADGQWIADIRTDIFALGCILYEMIAGVPPDQEQINQRSMYVTSSLTHRPNADLGLVKLINRAISYNTEHRYASAGEFLEDLREIAPPVLLVNRKNLWFGNVTPGQFIPPMTVKLYNAGGGEIRGEIKSRAPWIVVSEYRFAGNTHEVTVTVDPAKTKERGKPLTGKLEISSDGQSDSEGNVVAGDKWSVECSVTLQPSPGLLKVTELEGTQTTPLGFSGRKGQSITGTLHLRNVGEMPVDFEAIQTTDTITGGIGKPLEGLCVTPLEGTIEAGQTLAITIAISTAALPQGLYPAVVSIRTRGRQSLSVPISIRVISALDFVISKLGRHS
jgi:serine/threonine protein kinase